MHRFSPKLYLEVFRNRDFFVLSLVTFIGQLASAFLILSLIVSVFNQTGNNFGVSGVVLSFTIPGFFLILVAGLFADIFDRRKIIIIANTAIALVVLFILIAQQTVVASIPLSFLYFVGNTFFLPTASAASGQLVKNELLAVANTVFISVLASGLILGFFVAAVAHFFLGTFYTLIICETLLCTAVVISFFLPTMYPRKKHATKLVQTAYEIWKTIKYLFAEKTVRFFFVVFAASQGIIAFGVTLAPGFFNDVVGLSINKSPIFIFPLIGLGVIIGVLFLNIKAMSAGSIITFASFLMALAFIGIGVAIKFNLAQGSWIYLPVSVFLTILGFAEIISIITSRTVLQHRVSHNYQGTVFGATIILASFISAVMSPLAAQI